MADVKMPQLGESVTEGTIGRWLKQTGDTVHKYDALCEVITDKVNAEIPSDFEGVLTEILVPEGSTIPVGTLICRIQAEEDTAVKQVSNETAVPEPVPVDPNRPEPQAPRYSPAVLSLIQQHGVDPAVLTGTGLGGRITRKDVLAYLELQKTGAAGAERRVEKPVDVVAHAKPAVPAPPAGSAPPAPLPGPTAAKALDGETVIPLSPIRRTIANRMVQSKNTIPHAWTMIEVDVTGLVRLREKSKEEFLRREGVPLTYLPFFMKAIVEAIKEYPILNSTWAEDRIIVKRDINISMAVSAGEALYVPVIQRADRLSIAGLAHAIYELANKARGGKLSLDEVQGGTFTVNNTGAFGSIQSMPIVAPPQVANLSVESIVRRPVVTQDDAIAIRSMVNLCLSLDHRVLDGLVCGRFLAAVKSRLEGAWSQDAIL